MKSNYLLEMDESIRSFFASADVTSGEYIRGEFYHYVPVTFVAENIKFNFEFFAVKVGKTTIVLFERANCKRIHFSDNDIRIIMDFLKSSNPDFYSYLSLHLGYIINNTESCNITFKLNREEYVIKGIPFSADYSKVICKNPADIELNGNDLIALINLIIEKERTDQDKNKVNKTCRYFLDM